MIRALLTLGCLLVLALAVWGMWIGWKHRGRRQSALGELPQPPADPGSPLLDDATGLYVGTAFAESWQDRVVVGGLGLRATATASVTPAGVRYDREGADPVFVPAGTVVGARLAPGLAGKVVGAGGLLVVRWRQGDAVLDTGFRADDKSAYPRWVRAINEQLVRS